MLLNGLGASSGGFVYRTIRIIIRDSVRLAGRLAGSCVVDEKQASLFFSSQAKKVWTGQFEFVMLRLLCGEHFVKRRSLSRQTLKQNQKKRIVKERCRNQL